MDLGFSYGFVQLEARTKLENRIVLSLLAIKWMSH